MNCEYCREDTDAHTDRLFDGGVATCHLTNGLTIRTQTSAATEDASESSAGRGATTSRPGSPAHARDGGPSSVVERLIGMAARGTSHATTCPNVDFDSFYNVELKLS